MTDGRAWLCRSTRDCIDSLAAAVSWRSKRLNCWGGEDIMSIHPMLSFGLVEYEQRMDKIKGLMYQRDLDVVVLHDFPELLPVPGHSLHLLEHPVWQRCWLVVHHLLGLLPKPLTEAFCALR